ncbi:MAG: VOC family protein [Saprospiraceae bacterium]|nr:VOC family protein [Saprospiraceae bacterium]NNK90319.1 VOC family protein [Saprospiraceae bacterium]
MNNPVRWFEIPVLDMNRAIAFYNKVFGYNLVIQDLGELQMALFPSDLEQIGCAGALVYNAKFYKPSRIHGPLLYFETEDITAALGRAEELNGKIIIEERQISPEHGSMGVMEDSEGNRIALHAAPVKGG